MAEIVISDLKRLNIDEKIDKDGEIEVEIECAGDYQFIYINKDHAIKIVEHLTKVFELDNTTPDLKLPESQGVYLVKTKDGLEKKAWFYVSTGHWLDHVKGQNYEIGFGNRITINGVEHEIVSWEVVL